MTSYFDYYQTKQFSVPCDIFTHFKTLSLANEEFVMLMFLLSEGGAAKTSDFIAKASRVLHMSDRDVMSILNALLTRELLELQIIKDDHNIQRDYFTMRPLFDKLDQLTLAHESSGVSSRTLNQQTKESVSSSQSPRTTKPIENMSASTSMDLQQLMSIFEKEFGRFLSPMEFESINNWITIDHHSPEVICEALKEAVIHQALNIKYIDKILLNWQKKNIRTVQEAQQDIKRFQNRQSSSNFDKIASQQDEYADIVIPIYKMNDTQ